MRKLLSIGLLAILLVPLQAQELSLQTATFQSDTVAAETFSQPTAMRSRNPYYSHKQLIAPALLIASGTFGLADKSPVNWLDQKARDEINTSGKTISADEYLQYVPTGVHLVLGFVPGVKSKHNFRDRVIASATANLLMGATTNTVKYTVRRQRPDSEARNSFFSGHTATVFTGAELMRIEYGWGYGSAAYAVAAGVAFMRVYNKRHWVSDVLTGAGVGILCANAGYWMLPVWKRLFKIQDKPRVTADTMPESSSHHLHAPIIVAAPFYTVEDHGIGLACNIVF